MPGPWIRPVTERENEGVRYSESRYNDGGSPQLLDVMQVPILEARPDGHQQENWLIDTTRSWVRACKLDSSSLSNWIDEVDTLWVNRDDTLEGLNDSVAESDSKGLESSLYLIKASLRLKVSNYYAPRGTRRRVQGRFLYNGTEYRMWVTDPVYEEEYKGKPDGIYRINECFLCISLSGIYEGFAYKLIAAIIKP